MYSFQEIEHAVSSKGGKTDPEKVRAVWPVPRDLEELRSFVGFCGYYRWLKKDFARLATHLHHFSKMGMPLHWDQEHQGAFERLRLALVYAPVMKFPDPRSPFLLDCDASNEGVGAVFLRVKDGQEQVVEYYSSKFRSNEQNYCVTWKELLAIVKSFLQFHP